MFSSLRRVYLFSNALLCFLILYVPIFTLVVFSFNASRGTLVWEGFTLQWFVSIFENDAIVQAVMRSLEIALFTAVVATLLGVMMALGLRSLPKSSSAKWELFLMLPMLVPEIVTAVGLLMTFSKLYRPVLDYLAIDQSSSLSLVAGHLSFALSYVVVIVKARLVHLDPTLELVAKNLGSSRFQTFVSIILPQLFPAIACAFLLVFTLSLDDFYLSHFLSYGGSGFTTLPVYLYGLQARSGLTPEMNAVASLMVLSSIFLICVASVFSKQWIDQGFNKHAK